MEEVFEAEYVSLHVRKSNRAAFHLYTETLGYRSAHQRPNHRTQTTAEEGGAGRKHSAQV
jgi:ribosomal protein S18 acetylase RimI-like enzyme